ncbi:DUF4956 domain-containing protein [Candidatus Woesearchaeota archaeon]|jgi:uncharacterized membrane protein YhiD involved in acid resistance|nr:DUF4956 domain-containing protein [Candidatus Woesearchaeota archaeon]
MNQLETFENFLTSGTVQISLPYLVFSLISAAILSFILAKLYVKYGTAISNRSRFARNFVLLSTTTTLIITIVKSSLALSLGLVGALSIVRFRSAIKEPEELAFLFLCIAIGLGFGAGQVATTFVAFIVISLFIWGRHFTHKKEDHQNLYLSVSGKNLSLKKIVEVLKKNSLSVHLKRFDKLQDGLIEASFLIDLKSFTHLEKMREDLNAISKSINISYLDKLDI